MKNFGLYVLTPIVSFLGGFIAYALMLNYFFGEKLGNDTDTVLFYGGLAYLIYLVPFYLIVLHLIDKKFDRSRVILYPLACMLGFFIPVLLFMLFFEIGEGNLFSREAMLFHVFFLISGLIFGILTWVFKRFFHVENKEIEE